MKFSIITINYNDKDGLEQTIVSVLDQTFQDYQYIVIDGGSTDGSLDIIKRYSDHIDYWVSEPDEGIYNAMNKGIKHADGDYMNFMNSGDKFHSPDVLKSVYELNAEEDIICGLNFDMGRGVRNVSFPKEFTLLTLLKDNLNHQSTFYRRELFKNRQYDENYRILADLKFNLQSIILDNCSIRPIDYIIADYDTNGVSSTNKEKVSEERKRLLEELFPTRILKDYEKMYSEGEIPLIALLPELKQSPTIQRWIYKLTKVLIKYKKLKK